MSKNRGQNKDQITSKIYPGGGMWYNNYIDKWIVQ